MASKKDKFANTLGALPTKQAVASGSATALQSIVEGSRPEYRFIRLETISLNPENDYALEDTEQEIRELAEDIRRNGLLHNIVISLHPDGRYLLLSGERRLKAYQLLRNQEPEESKWESIYALVRKGLSPLEETIILDAANLQARGAGAKSEARYRKSTARFVQNLRKQFNISEAEAVELTKAFASASDSTIIRNISIEKKLIPSLKNLLDKGYIKKLVANTYATLNESQQQQIADSYDVLLSQNADLAAFGEDTVMAIKKHLPIQKVSNKIKQMPSSAKERQRQVLLKNCQRIDHSIDALTDKAALIKRMDADIGAGESEKISDIIQMLHEKLCQLKDILQ